MKLLLLFITLIILPFSLSAEIVNEDIANSKIFDGEPNIAINPTNNQNLVIAWMGMKFGNGIFRIAIKTKASFDGGRTWSAENSLPHFGTGYGSADVSLAFNKMGLLYICYIDYKQNPDEGGIYVSRSPNNGLNWNTPTKAFDMNDVPLKRPIDRPWLVVDNSSTKNSGTVYITTKPAPWIAPPNRNYFKVSTDNGFTWSTIENVDGGNHLVGNIIPQPMAAPTTTINGKFCAVYPSYLASQNLLPAFYLASSRDKGKTLDYSTVFTGVPTSGGDSNYKSLYWLLASSIDSNSMVLLIPTAANGDNDVFAYNTIDGGKNWSNAVRINDDLIGNGKAQDMVWGAFNEKGNLIVTWRDRRNSSANGFWNAGYDFYYAVSSNNGKTFSKNQKLSSQFIDFDSLLAQNGNDMMSTVYSGDTLYSTWGDTRSGKMNIYFAKTIAGTNTGIGFEEINKENNVFKSYPNPFTDKIKLTDSNIGEYYVLSDINGKILYSGQNISSQDFSYLSSGNYFLKRCLGEIVEILKLVK